MKKRRLTNREKEWLRKKRGPEKKEERFKEQEEPTILWRASARRLGRLKEFESWPFSYRTKPYRLHFKSPIEVSENQIIKLYEAIMFRTLGSLPKKRPTIKKTVDTLRKP